MPKCIVHGCTTRQSSRKQTAQHTLHSFPRTPDMIKSWLMATGQRFGNLDKLVHRIMGKRHGNFRMCSFHFTSDSYRTIGIQKHLKRDCVPSIFEHAPPKSIKNIGASTSVSSGCDVTIITESTSARLFSPLQSSVITVQSRRTAFQPMKRRRFMDHDYTDESAMYSFGDFFSQGTNTEVVMVDKSTCTERNFGQRTTVTQTQFGFGKKNARTSTEDLCRKKNAYTWTGLNEEQFVEVPRLLSVEGLSGSLTCVHTKDSGTWIGPNEDQFVAVANSMSIEKITVSNTRIEEPKISNNSFFRIRFIIPSRTEAQQILSCTFTFNS